jgi:PilZ domain
MFFGKRYPKGFHGAERRHERRTRTDVPAQIALDTGVVKCSIVDLSMSGAGLIMGSTFGIPGSFELRAGGHRYQAAVMRRSMSHIGVKFFG